MAHIRDFTGTSDYDMNMLEPRFAYPSPCLPMEVEQSSTQSSTMFGIPTVWLILGGILALVYLMR